MIRNDQTETDAALKKHVKGNASDHADGICGFLNVHKPLAMTSHDVVKVVRKRYGIKQVGHGGTLDPMAEGVLPLALGKATRLIRFLGADKTYRAEILLGTKTTTDDLEGETIGQWSGPLPDERAIREALALFTGSFEQIPPLYSAVHHGGKRLYELARAGCQPEEIKARPVHISSIDIESIEAGVVRCLVTCQAGTYIRSLARDLGEKLLVGGCLKSLVRTRSGSFSIENAVPVDQLAQIKDRDQLIALVIDPFTTLSAQPQFLVLQVDDDCVLRICMGQRLALDQFGLSEKDVLDKQILIARERRLIAVCVSQEGTIQPQVVVANAP